MSQTFIFLLDNNRLLSDGSINHSVLYLFWNLSSYIRLEKSSKEWQEELNISMMPPCKNWPRFTVFETFSITILQYNRLHEHTTYIFYHQQFNYQIVAAIAILITHHHQSSPVQSNSQENAMYLLLLLKMKVFILDKGLCTFSIHCLIYSYTQYDIAIGTDLFRD